MKALIAALSFSLVTFAAPSLAQEQPMRYADAAEVAKDVGGEYFAAYIARDWDSIEPLMADENSFHDDSAALVFGSVEYLGKENVLRGFREGYAGITHMKFTSLREMHAGHFAIFEGSLDWGVNVGGGRVVNSEMPFVVILRIENGKVTEHRDYADYSPFIAAMQSQENGAD